MSRPVGLKDVAALAGVSVKTVSNVVNGYAHVAPATRERVREAVEQLRYSPNLAARNLRQHRSGLVALALPEIDGPYQAEIARLIIEAAGQRGFTVVIERTGGRAERERDFVSGLRAQQVDVSILTPLALGQDALEECRRGRPLVLLGEAVGDGAIDRVAVDSRTAGRVATEHLVSLGARRIAALGAPADPRVLRAHSRRLAGYRDALREAGLDGPDALVVRVEQLDPPAGRDSMHRLLAARRAPDAVFCFNDTLAVGALRACHEAGLRVPEDIAIMGFDDIELGRYTTPTLTTVAPDKRQIAQVAVARALQQLDGGPAAEPVPTVGFELLARESTLGAAPREVTVRPRQVRASRNRSASPR